MDKLTNAEKLILEQVGTISYGKRGRPSTKKRKLIAQLAAVIALIHLKQSRKKQDEK